MRAVYLLVARQQAGRDFAIFTELQAAMQRIALDGRPEPGTKHGPRNHRTGERDIQTRQYADCHRGAVGNGIADTCAKRAVTAKALDGESKKAMGWASIALLRRTASSSRSKSVLQSALPQLQTRYQSGAPERTKDCGKPLQPAAERTRTHEWK